MNTLSRIMLNPFAKLIIIASLLLAPLLVYPPVAAHHCLGHEGEGPGDFRTCLDAGACVSTTGENCPNQNVQPEQRVNQIIRLVINMLSFIVGVVAVIMIIIGGLKYITSGGDSNNITSAKNTILYAVIGLVVVALAQIIVRFVLNKAAPDTAPAPAGIVRLT